MKGRVLMRTSCFSSSILMMVAVTIAAAAGKPVYAGWKTCAGCHPTAAVEWQKSRHAQAYQSLTNSKQGDLPGCVGCHVTGYNQEGGYIDYELTPELVGVQCEECHGPGSGHLQSATRNDIRSSPGVASCRRCHTQGQDPGFDYREKIRHVHGPQGNTM